MNDEEGVGGKPSVCVTGAGVLLWLRLPTEISGCSVCCEQEERVGLFLLSRPLSLKREQIHPTYHT